MNKKIKLTYPNFTIVYYSDKLIVSKDADTLAEIAQIFLSLKKEEQERMIIYTNHQVNSSGVTTYETYDYKTFQRIAKLQQL
jgi:hypothetical protein